jgi:hypothetical protein
MAEQKCKINGSGRNLRDGVLISRSIYISEMDNWFLVYYNFFNPQQRHEDPPYSAPHSGFLPDSDSDAADWSGLSCGFIKITWS